MTDARKELLDHMDNNRQLETAGNTWYGMSQLDDIEDFYSSSFHPTLASKLEHFAEDVIAIARHTNACKILVSEDIHSALCVCGSMEGLPLEEDNYGHIRVGYLKDGDNRYDVFVEKDQPSIKFFRHK